MWQDLAFAELVQTIYVDIYMIDAFFSAVFSPLSFVDIHLNI